MTAILWLRRDLRLSDSPALQAAIDAGGPFAPVFCLDPRLLHGKHRSDRRTAYLLSALRDLDRELQQLGSRLLVLAARPEQALGPLAVRLKATTVHAAADVSPFAQSRDRRVERELAAQGVKLALHPGTFVLDNLFALRTGSGGPYTVFTPFYKRWLAEPRRALVGTPERLPSLPDGWRTAGVGRVAETPGEAGTLADALERDSPLTAFVASAVDGDPAVGQRAARRALDTFLAEGVEAYGERHDDLSHPGTSGLSVALHFGTISAREVEYRLPDNDGGAALRRQLCWRDFYAHVLANHPGNARVEHQARFRRTIEWSGDRELFDAWCEGRTGYPLVDAGMRELAATGLMHNRARMVVGSFLVKDLGIDWRWGERWFMRELLDGDEANNNGNWQWIASVGVDPAPAARRIFNPTLQQQRFDPDGAYVRRHVPELRPVPDEYLAQPWTMPELLAREVGCVIGVDYPAPVVEHGAARRAALDRYRRALVPEAAEESSASGS